MYFISVFPKIEGDNLGHIFFNFLDKKHLVSSNLLFTLDLKNYKGGTSNKCKIFH